MFTTDTKFPTLNLNFLSVYAFDENGVNLINTELNNPTFKDTWSGLFKDSPFNYIVSIKAYPFDVLNMFNTWNYKDNTTLKIGGNTLTSFSAILKLEDIKGAIPIAEYTFVEYYGEHKFLNYPPYTKISAFVPFFGEVDLPVTEVMGKRITFYVSIDPYTGYGTLYVYNENTEYIILTKDSKIGIDIAMGGTNAVEVYKNYMLNGCAILGGAITSAYAGVSASALASSQISNTPSFVASLQEKVSRGTISNGFTNLVQDNKMYIIRQLPNVNIANLQNYKYFKGKPLMQFKTLGSLTGYTEVYDIHLEDMGDFITSTERDEIVSLLKTGVIF